MKGFLLGGSAASVVMGILLALDQPSWLLSVLSVLAGLLTALLFAALLRVLDQQEELGLRLDRMEMRLLQAGREPLRCTHCGETYDGELSSCPYCGRQTEKRESGDAI